MEWLAEIWSSFTAGRILLGVGVFLLSLGLSFAAIAIVMVLITLLLTISLGVFMNKRIKNIDIT